MHLGRDIIILSKDECKNIKEAISIVWTKSNLNRWGEAKVLNDIDRFYTLLKELKRDIKFEDEEY